MSVQFVIDDWKKGKFKPFYWVEGEEPFFIDQVINYAEQNLLSPEEAGFNLHILYGKDTLPAQLVNICKQYPMFGERQVVVLKEAQHLKEVDALASYFENPQPTTLLVIGHKEKKLDKRSKVSKLIAKNGELVTTKKVYENQLPMLVSKMAEEAGFTFEQKALHLLIDHVGNDLGRLHNEIEKLRVNIKGRSQITTSDIETFIGISKDFNAFELQDALATKDLAKCIRIIQYFDANPKAGPIQLILPTLFNYFSKIYKLHGIGNVSDSVLRPLFFNNPVAMQQAKEAYKNYSFQELEKVFLLLEQYNLRSVGVNDQGTSDADLLKEVVCKIIQS
ncbi:MAG: DNA polymerase III subunit delta [Hydrotalea sp.]|nr:DNA polymerase III subunit delta [Hydrotalea sp.]